MQYGIAIPTPCHEDWNEMTPNSIGRHCGQCCKTVIDFTEWNADDIAAYLAAKRFESVCGRFKQDQLAKVTIAPETYLYELQQTNFSLLKKIAAVFIFVFCLSTNVDAQQQPSKQAVPQKMMGEPARVEQGEVKVQETPAKPNVALIVKSADKADQMIMGGIRPYPFQDTARVKRRVQTTPPRKNK